MCLSSELNDDIAMLRVFTRYDLRVAERRARLLRNAFERLRQSMLRRADAIIAQITQARDARRSVTALPGPAYARGARGNRPQTGRRLIREVAPDRIGGWYEDDPTETPEGGVQFWWTRRRHRLFRNNAGELLGSREIDLDKYSRFGKGGVSGRNQGNNFRPPGFF